MQFFDSTNKSGLVSDCFYFIFGDSDDHTAEYPLVDLARNMNRYYDDTVSLILKADHRWEWDDDNQSNLPIFRISLVANQGDYGISATTFTRIRKVEIKDQNGEFIPLTRFTLDDLPNIADKKFLSDAGTPRFFRTQASSMFLKPAPNYASVDGLRIFAQRNAIVFTKDDTTKEPGFERRYHRILSLGAAYDYAIANELDSKAVSLLNRLTLLQNDIVDDYTSRNTDRVALRTRKEDYGARVNSSGIGGFHGHPNRFF